MYGEGNRNLRFEEMYTSIYFSCWSSVLVLLLLLALPLVNINGKLNFNMNCSSGCREKKYFKL